MIEIEALTKMYGSAQVRAVDEVSLHIPAGSVFGFLGPNGAGKTTTIKMLAGLLTPTSGQVRLGGFDVVRQRSAAMAQFGAVLEGSRNVYWSLSAWQNLMYFGRLKGLRKAQVSERAEDLLSGLGLWERRDDKVGGFSRGMQQKVAIATALIADPPIVLLDEPTLGLDVEATRVVKDWIAELARELGTTILLTSHQLDVVQELCDRVAVIRRGRLVADLPTRELLAGFRERDKYEIRIEGAAPRRVRRRHPRGRHHDERAGERSARGVRRGRAPARARGRPGVADPGAARPGGCVPRPGERGVPCLTCWARRSARACAFSWPIRSDMSSPC
ncbi:ABC transporter ATP-binding protein [Nonomuraea dietziae]|uniref:ABC transporter ATP-binding protein n=1 Tax=Nonomuraea dietziae TaxID=65515 RepID=UPI0031E33A20